MSTIDTPPHHAIAESAARWEAPIEKAKRDLHEPSTPTVQKASVFPDAELLAEEWGFGEWELVAVPEGALTQIEAIPLDETQSLVVNELAERFIESYRHPNQIPDPRIVDLLEELSDWKPGAVVQADRELGQVFEAINFETETLIWSRHPKPNLAYINHWEAGKTLLDETLYRTGTNYEALELSAFSGNAEQKQLSDAVLGELLNAQGIDFPDREALAAFQFVIDEEMKGLLNYYVSQGLHEGPESLDAWGLSHIPVGAQVGISEVGTLMYENPVAGPTLTAGTLYGFHRALTTWLPALRNGTLQQQAPYLAAALPWLFKTGAILARAHPVSATIITLVMIGAPLTKLAYNAYQGGFGETAHERAQGKIRLGKELVWFAPALAPRALRSTRDAVYALEGEAAQRTIARFANAETAWVIRVGVASIRRALNIDMKLWGRAAGGGSRPSPDFGARPAHAEPSVNMPPRLSRPLIRE